jgi:hypothetical protein
LRQRLPYFALLFILLISIWSLANLKWSRTYWKHTVTSDGKGYYAYLPAAFIYHDLNIGFFDSIETKYYDKHTKSDFRNYADGRVMIKYFCGVSVLQIPFFACGHVAAQVCGADTDGYSKPYMIAISLGALFYALLGLFYLRKFLQLHGANPLQTAFILLLIYFGTNLYYYTVLEPLMSHVYSFALVSIFLYYGKKWMQEGQTNYAFISVIILTFIILVRPINVLAAFWLIYEADGLKNFIRRLREFLLRFSVSVPALLLSFGILFLQCLIYKIQTGHYWIYAYGEEGFNFTKPEIFNFLFSYKKGLFVYLPLLFISLGGFYFLWKQNRGKAIFHFAFLFSISYILSSWWMWYYGGSFGTRVIIEFLPFFALLFFHFMQGVQKKSVRVILTSSLVLLTLYTQLETWQYRYEIIHWSEMNQEKYWDAFLRFP